MRPEEKIQQIAEFLLTHADGYDAEEATAAAAEAVEEGEPILETMCLHMLAEHILASIHNSAWITNRAAQPECDDHDVIKRLLDSGASADDLALFARMMQREYLSNLGCILDGSGVYGTPKLPCEQFRVFCVDDDDQPQVMIDELHESLAFSDVETEMELSRKSEDTE